MIRHMYTITPKKKSNAIEGYFKRISPRDKENP